MMEKYYRLSDCYTWTINNMDKVPIEYHDKIIENLKNVKWIPELIEELNSWGRELLKQYLIKGLSDEAMPVCVMSLCCMSHNLKLKGTDVTDLEAAINTSDRVYKAVMELFQCDPQYIVRR